MAAFVRYTLNSQYLPSVSFSARKGARHARTPKRVHANLTAKTGAQENMRGETYLSVTECCSALLCVQQYTEWFHDRILSAVVSIALSLSLSSPLSQPLASPRNAVPTKVENPVWRWGCDGPLPPFDDGLTPWLEQRVMFDDNPLVGLSRV